MRSIAGVTQNQNGAYLHSPPTCRKLKSVISQTTILAATAMTICPGQYFLPSIYPISTPRRSHDQTCRPLQKNPHWVLLHRSKQKSVWWVASPKFYRFGNHSQICNGTPAYRDGQNIYPTCGMACSSKLLSACGLPNTNEPRTSDPTLSSAPNILDKNQKFPRWSSELSRRKSDTPFGMCVVSS